MQFDIKLLEFETLLELLKIRNQKDYERELKKYCMQFKKLECKNTSDDFADEMVQSDFETSKYGFNKNNEHQGIINLDDSFHAKMCDVFKELVDSNINLEYTRDVEDLRYLLFSFLIKAKVKEIVKFAYNNLKIKEVSFYLNEMRNNSLVKKNYFVILSLLDTKTLWDLIIKCKSHLVSKEFDGIENIDDLNTDTSFFNVVTSIFKIILYNELIQVSKIKDDELYAEIKRQTAEDAENKATMWDFYGYEGPESGESFSRYLETHGLD